MLIWLLIRSIEWLLLDNEDQITHFITTYSDKFPGDINFYYLAKGDNGNNSTVGVQGLTADDCMSPDCIFTD